MTSPRSLLRLNAEVKRYVLMTPMIRMTSVMKMVTLF